MQEFSSVTASSYDADALTPLLNEKAADGWEVVSIVAAGTNIVAYLQRESSGAGAPASGSTETPMTETSHITGAVPTLPGETPAEPEQAAVEEPAGWAVAPDNADTSASTSPPAVEQPVVAASPEPAAVEPAAAEPAVAAQPAAAEPAPTESAVPAGWYADPSGRFELRYWDGNAWTEHVSRGGQQFTDPPVA